MQELIRKFSELHDEILMAERDLKKNKADLEKIEQSLKDSETIRDKAKQDAINEQRENWIKQNTKEINKQIKDLENEKEQTVEDYKNRKSSLSVEDFSDEYVDRQEIIDEIQNNITLTKKLVTDCVGSQICDAVEASVPNKGVAMTPEELSKTVELFNSTENLLTVFSKIKNPFLKVVNAVESINTGSINLAYKYTIPVFCVIYLILIVVASRFVFPILAVLLFVCGAYGVFSSYFCNKMLTTSLLLRNNVDQVIEELEHDMSASYEQALADLDAEFKQTVSEIEDDMNNLMNEYQKAEEDAAASFQFDDSSVASDALIEIEHLQHRKEELDSDIKRSQETIQGKTIDLKGLKDEIENKVKEYGKELVVIGDGFELPEQILIDYDPQTVNVSYFTAKYESAFYIYQDSIDETFDFVKLWVTAIRHNSSPASTVIRIFDAKRMGTALIPLEQPTEDLAAKGLFKIYKKPEDFKNAIKEESEEIDKRNAMILSSGDSTNIKEYNKKMASLKSVQTNYEIWFIWLNETSMLNDVGLRQLIINGAAVGIVMNVFMSFEDVKKHAKDVKESIEFFTNFYKIGSGTITTTSRKSFTAFAEKYAK